MAKYKNKLIKRKTHFGNFYNRRSIIKNNPYGFGIAAYCGPGTKMNNQKPTNASDNVCKNHDYDFEKINSDFASRKISENEAIKQTRIADQRMLSDLENIKEESFSGKAVQSLSYYGIKFKILLENLGILDPLKFSSP